METSLAPLVSQAEKGTVGDRCRLLHHGESMGKIHTLAEWLMFCFFFYPFSGRFEISHHMIPVDASSTWWTCQFLTSWLVTWIDIITRRSSEWLLLLLRAFHVINHSKLQNLRKWHFSDSSGPWTRLWSALPWWDFDISAGTAVLSYQIVHPGNAAEVSRKREWIFNFHFIRPHQGPVWTQQWKEMPYRQAAEWMSEHY